MVIYGSFVLALCGWVGAAWSWVDHGDAAGVNPGFITALSVGITFTMTLAVVVVLPDANRIYALGFRHGVDQGLAMSGDPEPSRLAVVR